MGLCWSALTVPYCLLPFAANIQQEEGIQSAAGPTRKRNILEFVFAVELMHFPKSVHFGSPGCGHLSTSYTFTLPFQSSFSFSICRPQFKANGDRLPVLLRSCSWGSFLSTEVQIATEKLYSFLHEWLGSTTPAHPHRMPDKRNRHDRLRSRKKFLKPGTFLCFYCLIACQKN